MTTTKTANESAADERASGRLGRQVRAGLIRDLQSSLSGTDAVVVVRIDRVATRELNRLRQSLQGLESNLLITKNSLSRRVFQGIGWAGLEKGLEGTCGIGAIRGDVAAACRLLALFSKEHEGFALRGGILKGQLLQAEELALLARLPGREVLLSWLAGVAQSPLRNLAFLFQGPIRSLMLALAAVKQKKGE
ncbi:MAG: 50S ribosomal protein L10 [Candidatus Omnitrophica bacterium]|nr:50S ribosomal protein L10 [Candidatus Omnitrophota bacterium]